MFNSSSDDVKVDNDPGAVRATISKGLRPALDFLFRHRHRNEPIPKIVSRTTAISSTQPNNDPIGKVGNGDTAAPRLAYGFQLGAASQTDPGAGVKAQSIKCSECGKIFKNAKLANFHVEKSGHDQFGESPDPQPEPDLIAAEAENSKERDNDSFKHGQYGSIAPPPPPSLEAHKDVPNNLVSTKPVYLTKRAAAYMALKRFRPALADYGLPTRHDPSKQHARARLAPSTLLRLARCHLALAQTTAALSTLRGVLAAEPGQGACDADAGAGARTRVPRAQSRGHREEKARRVGPGTCRARAVFADCRGGRGEERVPDRVSALELEWREWRGQLSTAAATKPNSADMLTLRGLILFLGGLLPQAFQHAQSALRSESGHEPAQLLQNRVTEVERLMKEGKGSRLRAVLLSNCAGILVKLCRYDDAITDFRATLELAESKGADRRRGGPKKGLSAKSLKSHPDKVQSFPISLVFAILSFSSFSPPWADTGGGGFPIIDRAVMRIGLSSSLEAYEVLSDRRRREQHDLGKDEDEEGATI
ncbi:hypothetical protein BJV74DRAFT_797408 [Russula compacta]|nr:hypothetical protein BJV74DRAFT_797408 [Russula compacta]